MAGGQSLTSPSVPPDLDLPNPVSSFNQDCELADRQMDVNFDFSIVSPCPPTTHMESTTFEAERRYHTLHYCPTHFCSRFSLMVTFMLNCCQHGLLINRDFGTLISRKQVFVQNFDIVECLYTCHISDILYKGGPMFTYALSVFTNNSTLCISSYTSYVEYTIQGLHNSCPIGLKFLHIDFCEFDTYVRDANLDSCLIILGIRISNSISYDIRPNVGLGNVIFLRASLLPGSPSIPASVLSPDCTRPPAPSSLRASFFSEIPDRYIIVLPFLSVSTLLNPPVIPIPNHSSQTKLQYKNRTMSKFSNLCKNQQFDHEGPLNVNKNQLQYKIQSRGNLSGYKFYCFLIVWVVLTLCSFACSFSLVNDKDKGQCQQQDYSLPTVCKPTYPLHPDLPRLSSDHINNAQVYMLMADDDDLSVFQTSNSSTPRKKKKKKASTAPISSSQPLPKTMSPLLNPSEKIASRLRTFSQTSDISISDGSSAKNITRKSKSVPKRITEDGTYTLDPRKKTCSLQYMEEYIDIDEADRLQEELNRYLTESHTGTADAKVGKDAWILEIDGDLLPQTDLPDAALVKQTGFLAKRLERSMSTVLDVNTNFSSVHIRRLPSYSDHIPYESLSGKNGANPVVAMLSLGAPRLLKLRKGTRITHVVSLHPGSLCVLSGNTSLEYSHSIPKGHVDSEIEQILLFFVGSPSKDVNVSESDSASSVLTESSLEGMTSTAGEASESDLDSDRHEIRYTSLLQNVGLPAIQITPSTPETNSQVCADKSEEVMSDILNMDLMNPMSVTSDVKDDEKGQLSQRDQERKPDSRNNSLTLKREDSEVNMGANSLHTPEECEQTVIQIADSPAYETINACAYYLPENVLNEELARNGCSTTGTLLERRSRMSKLLSLHQKKSSDCHHPSQVPPMAWTQSMLENTQLDIKEEIRKLSDEIMDMRSESGATNNVKSIEKLLEENKKLTRSLQDAWEKNLSAASQIKNQIDDFFREIHFADLKTDELEKSIRVLKCDLKNYYNSAFFREDSVLIKKIHNVVSKIDQDVLNPQQPDASPTIHPSAPPQSPAPLPTSRPPLAPSAPPLPEEAEMRSAPITHQGSDFGSRRGTGFTMTNSVRRGQLQHPSQVNHQREGTRFGTHNVEAPRATQTRKKFKTVLITDSILRHVTEMDTINALGVNHELHVINKRDTSCLTDSRLREEICELEPDFIYIHLGVNDIHQKVPLKQILCNIYGFNLFTDDRLPSSKTFLSLPLLTGDPQANEDIAVLRDCLNYLVNELNKTDFRPLRIRNLFLNQNNNFMRDGRIVYEYYRNDFVHPSERGKAVLLGNLRHSIHEMTRIILNKPKRARTSRNHHAVHQVSII